MPRLSFAFPATPSVVRTLIQAKAAVTATFAAECATAALADAAPPGGGQADP